LSAAFIDPQCGHDTGAIAGPDGSVGVIGEGGAGGVAFALCPAIGAPHVSHHSASPDT
jgi:hypothetical protein